MLDRTAFERIPLDFKVVDAPDLLLGHEVRFTKVGLDGIGIRVEYTIAPAISIGSLAWSGVARDDLGHEWEDVGGAYGPSSDGRCTEGVMTFELESDAAAELTVWLTPRDSDPVRAPAYRLAISLAL